MSINELDADSVDRSLERLHRLTTVDDRLEILKRLVEYWHGPIRPSDGLPNAEFASLNLPRPLRWWYQWAGRRNEIMSGQNKLLSPCDEIHPYLQLSIVDERLMFYMENQGVYSWATLPEGDDPPVFGRFDASDPWEPEQITLSEHLILACIFEAIMCHAPYRASAAALGQRTLSTIEQVITPIAINAWRWFGTRVYGKGGAFMCSATNGTGLYSVWIGSKRREPLQFLKPHFDKAWEYKSI